MPATADSHAIAPAAGAVPARPALDEVMLAMDIVDTLRHDHSLAAEALGDAAREQALIDQVRRTYADQGIAVSDQVIADAVASLRERRFQYRAPTPSLPVRLAKIYVSRDRWAPRLAAAVIFVGVLLLGAHLAGSFIDNVRFKSDLNAAHELQVKAMIVAGNAGNQLRGYEIMPVANAPVQVRDSLAESAARVAALHAQVQTLPPPLERPVHDARDALRQLWEDDPAVLERAIAETEPLIERTERELDVESDRFRALLGMLHARKSVTTMLASLAALDTLPPGVVDRARRLAGEFDSAMQRSDVDAARRAHASLEALSERATRRAGIDTSAIPVAHRAVAAGHLAAMDAALLAADASAFDRAEAALDALTSTLATAYTLRIVNRQGEQSGVWRHPNDNRNARNYYVVVDAIGADGGRVRIPVRNEETGRTEQVSTFAVRVPEAVYEQVKADKLDNGLIDRNAFGEKRVGELEPRYAFETAGGAITDW